MKKRLLSGFLCLCMLLTLVPTVALAAEEPAPAASTTGAENQGTTTTPAVSSDEEESGKAVAQIGDKTYSSLSEAITAATENPAENPVTIELVDNVTDTDAITIPVGANLVIDGKEHTFNGSISCVANSSQANKAAADNENEKAETRLTIQNLKMNGEGIDDGFGIYSGNQKQDGQMDLYLTVEDCIIRNYEAKGMYLTNTKKLVLDTCTFEDNANNFGFLKGQGDFAVDLNLCAVQDAEITIENCTFKGDNGLTAPIKIAARGGTDDQESDIKEAGAATIESVTITGCKFAEGTNTAIKLGTKAHSSTGAFDVELKENTCGVSDPVSVSLGYKSGSIKVPSGATLELNNSEEGATDVAPVALMKGKVYSSIGNALSSVEKGQKTTITLLQSTTEDVTIPCGSDLVIEGDGKYIALKGQITCTATTGEGQTGNTQLTLKNLTLNGNKEKNFAVIAQNQKVENNLSELSLTLENCTVQNYVKKALYLTNAKELTVTGCTFKNNATGTMDSPNTSGDYTIDLNLVGVQDTVVNIKDTTFSGDCGDKAVVKIAARGSEDGTGATDLSGPNATVKSLTIEGCTFNQSKNSDQAVPALNIGTNVKKESDKSNITGAYEVTIKENLTDMLIKLPYLDKESAQSVTVAAGATAYKDANGSFETVTAVVDAAKPEVSVSTEGMTEAESSLATSLKNALENENSAPSVTGNGLTQATNNAAAAIPAETMTEAAKALAEAGITTENSTVMVVVQPYMEIQITDVAISGESESQTQTLTVDITPKYNIIATTEDAVNSENGIVTEAGAEGSPAKNSVIMGSAKDLTVSEPVTVEIPLPASFVGDKEKLYVEHTKNGVTYVYEGDVTAPEETEKASGETQSTEGVKILTFINPHGFSTFTISAENRAEAKIGETSYLSLQDAVNAVADNGEITVLKDGLAATVSGDSKTFTLKNSDTSNSINVTLNGKTLTISANSSQSFTYIKPSGGGGGGGGGSVTTKYTLSFDTNGGSAIAKVTKEKGTTVDLGQYVPTREGYTFAGWYSDEALTQKVTSVKLNGNTTVYAKWTENAVTPTLPFTDVKSGDWFYEAVQYVYDKGMMTGVSADRFAPASTTTRGMIVTILYRLENEPAVSGGSAFTDVENGAWYADAVAWAAANDIVNGTSATTFAPNSPITREQMAAILYRYAAYKGYDVSQKADLSGYTDAASISGYAKDALAWANAQKLITGVTDTTLNPQGSATRAQVATILMRLCETVVK